MKICHATDMLPEYHEGWGGAEQACYRYIKLLTRSNFSCSVIATKPVRTVNEDFSFYVSKTLDSYGGKILGSFFRGIKRLSFPFDPVSFFHSYRILNKIKPDILHLHNFKILSFSIISAAKLLKIPIVVTIYDYWFFCPKETLIDKKNDLCKKYHGIYCRNCYNPSKFRSLSKILSAFRKPLFSYFIKKVDVFTVLSNSSAVILSDFAIQRNRICVVHQPFRFENLPLDTSSTRVENLSILYIGWVQQRKGLHVLLHAMPAILRKKPEAKLYVVGELEDLQYEQFIRKLIKQKGLSKNVSILGKKSHDEVKEFMVKANVVVVPEQWENMSPVVVVEAMAYSKPVVASRIGGIPEFIKDRKSGFLVEPTNFKEFADKILLLLKNKEISRKIATQARKDIVKLCDESKIKKDLLEVYSIARREKDVD